MFTGLGTLRLIKVYSSWGGVTPVVRHVGDCEGCGIPSLVTPGCWYGPTRLRTLALSQAGELLGVAMRMVRLVWQVVVPVWPERWLDARERKRGTSPH